MDLKSKESALIRFEEVDMHLAYIQYLEKPFVEDNMKDEIRGIRNALNAIACRIHQYTVKDENAVDTDWID